MSSARELYDIDPRHFWAADITMFNECQDAGDSVEVAVAYVLKESKKESLQDYVCALSRADARMFPNEVEGWALSGDDADNVLRMLDQPNLTAYFTFMGNCEVGSIKNWLNHRRLATFNDMYLTDMTMLSSRHLETMLIDALIHPLDYLSGYFGFEQSEKDVLYFWPLPRSYKRLLGDAWISCDDSNYSHVHNDPSVEHHAPPSV
jgi:hypothetical protein